jgi:GH24 family phage-related lysozyme (muramidase)
MAPTFRDIKVSESAASEVFAQRTVPLFHALTRKTFPGMEQLPADAQGALLSLVYNRGSALSGDRRTEMRAIRDIIQNAVQSGSVKSNLRPVLHAIAAEVQSMKRLWVNAGVPGLLRRRDAEAELIRNA